MWSWLIAKTTDYSPSQAEALATTAADLSGDAGVVAFLGDAPPAADSATRLYNDLASGNFGKCDTKSHLAKATTKALNELSADTMSAVASLDSAVSDALSTGVSPATSAAVNFDLSSVLKDNPSLATLIAQLGAPQPLIDAFA